MLRRGSLDGCRRGQVRALEVGGGEVGDTVPDGRAELCDRLLDLGGIVVGLGLVDTGDPA